MKKLLTIIILLISFTGYTQDVFQEHLYPTDLVLKYSKKLELSEKQISNIKNVYNSNIANYNSLKWDLDAGMVRLGEILSGARVDSTKALQQMDKILALETALKAQRLSLLISVKNELTAEQQQKLNKYKSDNNLPLNLITPINENPRVVLRVDGPEASNQPLYLILDKGEKRKVDKLQDIDPNDIKSIVVIKGENAIETYGEEGKNGVVIIELKKRR